MDQPAFADGQGTEGADCQYGRVPAQPDGGRTERRHRGAGPESGESECGGGHFCDPGIQYSCDQLFLSLFINFLQQYFIYCNLFNIL